MKISTRQRDGITVIDLSGKLEGGEDNFMLVEMLSDLGRQSRLDVIINCRKVKWISSTGVGILMRARGRYLEHGGVVRLCELNGRNLSLLEVLHLGQLFKLFESEDQALADVGG